MRWFQPKRIRSGTSWSFVTRPTHSQPTGGPTHSQPTNSTNDSRGTTMTNPATMQDVITFDSVSSDDSTATVDVSFEEVQWDATQAVRTGERSVFEEPSSDQVYIRLKVKATYHGSGKFSPYSLHIDYVKDGNATSSTSDIADESFTMQTEPRDGGNITGYFTFLVSKDGVKDGVFAVSTSSYNSKEVYVKAE